MNAWQAPAASACSAHGTIRFARTDLILIAFGMGTRVVLVIPQSPSSLMQHPSASDLSPPAGPHRVYIVDDHSIARRGLRQLFDREVDFTVCGEAATASDAFESIMDLQPDLVISDLKLEGQDGLDLTKQLDAHAPEVPILILSMHDERLYAERALAAGARGYAMKRSDDAELLRAARLVVSGRIYLTESLREKFREQGDPLAPSRDPSLTDRLTDRELEVFLLLGQGFAPRHIADKLNLSVSTIEVYRGRLKDKLHLDSSSMLTRYAVRWCRDHDLQ
jgi:DNA-binding NarL/FixJ family response regulator